MISLTKDNFNTAISHGRILVNFGATWCGYCRVMTPVVEELANKYSDVIQAAKVDVDEEEALADHYEIATYPTFILFENGVEVNRKTAANSIEELERMMAQ